MKRRILSFPTWGSVALLVFSLFIKAADAQVLYGSLTGNVTDPTDAAVPGAQVQATNVGTGVTLQTVTDARGAYIVNNVQMGTYKVTFTAKGFQTSVVNDVVVNANEVRRVDVKL